MPVNKAIVQAEEPVERAEVEAITPINEETMESAENEPIEIPASDEPETLEGTLEQSEQSAESDLENAESDETAPIEVEAPPVEEESVKNTPKVTQQAEALKAALRRAQANQKNVGKAPQANRQGPQIKKSGDKAVDDRRRTMLLGKKATRTITADSGEVIVEEGAEITEEVLQKAKLANKFIELSMNYTP